MPAVTISRNLRWVVLLSIHPYTWILSPRSSQFLWWRWLCNAIWANDTVPGYTSDTFYMNSDVSRLRRETLPFENSSTLTTIGKRAFAGCKLDSITIPALVETIKGSALVHCSFKAIRVAPGALNFNAVSYFGSEREVSVPKRVQLLRISRFSRKTHLWEMV
jgi:hypothetical protein